MVCTVLCVCTSQMRIVPTSHAAAKYRLSSEKAQADGPTVLEQDAETRFGGTEIRINPKSAKQINFLYIITPYGVNSPATFILYTTCRNAGISLRLRPGLCL